MAVVWEPPSLVRTRRQRRCPPPLSAAQTPQGDDLAAAARGLATGHAPGAPGGRAGGGAGMTAAEVDAAEARMYGLAAAALVGVRPEATDGGGGDDAEVERSLERTRLQVRPLGMGAVGRLAVCCDTIEA
jgi:hypothetical protein